MRFDITQPFTLTVGPVPSRKGSWLGVLQAGGWYAIAKFGSEGSAGEFLEIMERLGVNIEGGDDDV